MRTAWYARFMIPEIEVSDPKIAKIYYLNYDHVPKMLFYGWKITPKARKNVFLPTKTTNKSGGDEIYCGWKIFSNIQKNEYLCTRNQSLKQ